MAGPDWKKDFCCVCQVWTVISNVGRTLLQLLEGETMRDYRPKGRGTLQMTFQKVIQAIKLSWVLPGRIQRFLVLCLTARESIMPYAQDLRTDSESDSSF